MPPTLSNLRDDLERGLAAALQGPLDRPAAEAAARAVLNGAPLPPEVAARCGDAPLAMLVSFDADRIQSWVFASERVQVGKGASFTLDQLNHDVCRMPGEIDGITGVVYSAGGGGMLFARAGDDINGLIDRVRQWLERRSLELTFTVVALPLFARDLAPSAPPRPLPAGGVAALDRFEQVDGVRGALVRLQVLVRQAKDAHPRFRGAHPKLPVRPGAAADRCPSCNRRPRAKSDRTDDGPWTWCSHCRELRDVCLAEEKSGDNEKAPTFADLAEAGASQRRYLGFVAVDGNGMGQVVQGVRNFLQLRAFSEATTAVYEQARRQVDGLLTHGFLRDGCDPGQASLSLLSGGDEITLVLPSAAAPYAANAVLREVETGFDRLTASGGLLHEAFLGEPDLLERLRGAGAAAGWIAARPEYPVRLLRRYAEALQKTAKEVCGPGAARSAAAWRLLSDASPLPEGIAPESRPAELPLASQERLLREAEALRKEKVPTSALWTVLGQIRKEDESLRSVPHGPGRNEVLGLLGANFFRYQMARHARLTAWWQQVRGSSTPQELDDVARWFQAGGTQRLERLLDLHSLALFQGAPDEEAA